MPAAILEIQGLDELKRALDTVPKIAQPIAVQAMREALLLVQGTVQEYPTSTEANAPGRMDAAGKPLAYYDRGEGTWYPVVKQSTLGGMTKKSQGAIILSKKKRAAQKIYGYKLARTSEELGRKWYTNVTATDTEIVGRLGNSASYVDYVQGREQTAVHKKIGWVTVDQAVADQRQNIMQVFEKAAADILKKMGGTP